MEKQRRLDPEEYMTRGMLEPVGDQGELRPVFDESTPTPTEGIANANKIKRAENAEKLKKKIEDLRSSAHYARRAGEAEEMRRQADKLHEELDVFLREDADIKQPSADPERSEWRDDLAGQDAGNSLALGADARNKLEEFLMSEEDGAEKV